MTLKTALHVGGDSSEAKQALAELDTSLALVEETTGAVGKELDRTTGALDNMKEAEDGATSATVDLVREQEKVVQVVRIAAEESLNLNAEYQRLASAMEGLALNQAQATREVEAAKKAYADGEIGLADYNLSLIQTKTGLSLLSDEYQVALGDVKKFVREQTIADDTAKRAGHSARSLANDVSGVARSFADGAGPMEVFTQHGAGVIDSIGGMSKGAGGLIGFLAGPWGIVIGVAATALLPLIANLFETEEALDNVGDAAEEAMSKLNATLSNAGQFQEAIDASQTKLIDGMAALGQANRDILETQRMIEAMTGAAGIDGRAVSSLQGQLAGLKEEKAAAKLEISEARSAFNEIRGLRSAQSLQGTNRARNRERPAESTSRVSAGRVRAAGLSDEARAQQQAAKATQNYIAGLTSEIAAIGLDEKALRRLEVQRAKEAAQTDAQRLQIDMLNITRETALGLEERKQQAGAIANDNEDLSGSIAAIQREAQVLELVGWQRERLMMQLELEASLRPKLIALAQAEASGHRGIADALKRQIDLLRQKSGLQINMGDETELILDERDAADATAESYAHLAREASGALSDMALHGDKAIEVMKQLALSLAEAALQSALMNEGPLAGLFGSGDGLLGSLLNSGGARASGGPVSPGSIYTVNEESTAPGLFIPIAPGRINAPTNDNARGASSQSAAASNYFDLRGAVVTEDLLSQMNAISRQHAAQAIAGYDQISGERLQDHLSRRA